MLLFWCCQRIPGSAAFKRALCCWLVSVMQLYASNIRDISIQQSVQIHREGEKITVCPVTLLVSSVQDTVYLTGSDVPLSWQLFSHPYASSTMGYCKVLR